MDKEYEDYGLFCQDLPTQAYTDGRLILVTGANGYIGSRLIPELIARKYKVRILVRTYAPEFKFWWPEIEVVVADALDFDSLANALKGVHTAYYLIHSLGLGNKNFESVDLKIAANFRKASEINDIKRIIYLGGLGDTTTKLSPHLDNRIKVAQELANGVIPVTILRAAMIIGSGSASFKILKSMVLKAPVFLVPKWAKTKSQPISIRGVIKYLVGVLEVESTAGKSFDIGGNDIISYEEKLKILSKILGKKRYFIPVPINSTSFYATVISFLAPVPKPITKVLVEGCKNEVVCQNNEIKEYLTIELLSFEEALKRALAIEQITSFKPK